MSSDIAWAVTRNNSAFLLKKRNCPKPFSTDPLNLTNKNSARYNGYLRRKALGVAAAPGDKGLVLSVRVPSKTNRPSKSVNAVQMKSGARSSLTKVSSLVTKQRYRKDLRKAALRRASAILRAQKPLPARKGGAKKPAAKKE